jgi:hypothetical protein
MPDWLGLALLAAVSGAGMLWVFGKTTSQKRIKQARDRTMAAIYEVRLYLDSPRRVTAAMGRLLGWSFAHLALMLPAFFIMAGPLTLLGMHMDLRYGVAPVQKDRPVVVRIDLDPGHDGDEISVEPATRGVEVTSPPLYVEDEHRVYVRIEVTRPSDQEITVRAGNEETSKKITAAPDARSVSPQRSAGLGALWAFGLERPLRAGVGVERITIDHPQRQQRWLGLAIPWWLYWLGVVMITALALRRVMGVEI